MLLPKNLQNLVDNHNCRIEQKCDQVRVSSKSLRGLSKKMYWLISVHLRSLWEDVGWLWYERGRGRDTFVGAVVARRCIDTQQQNIWKREWGG
jgi:hypothetical protein